MILPSQRRINLEDFTADEQDLVSKLASTININTENVYTALNNDLNFSDNFDVTVQSLPVIVNSSGIPTTPTSFSLGTTNNVVPKASGMLVTNAINTTNSNIYPTGAPFISFTQSQDSVTVNHITGLPAGNSFTLTIIVFH
jgi:hypothetical protein